MIGDPRILRGQDREQIRSPVLLAAFRGWNDAGDAASFAAQHLGRAWGVTKAASIDPEDFFDFQAVRPQVHLIDGETREITWPQNEFFTARLEGHDHDALILVGTEPNTHWRTFAGLIVEVAREHEVEFVITLGALLADVPHTRPVQITGTAVGRELIERLGLVRSRYEGPTGIVGVLHDAFARAEVESASLWAAVPHYLGVSPNPKAALALVDKVAQLVGWPVDVSALEAAAAHYEEKVNEMISDDEDASAYVRLLEERTDEREAAQLEEIDPSKLPSGDALAQEFERFLQDRSDDGEG